MALLRVPHYYEAAGTEVSSDSNDRSVFHVACFVDDVASNQRRIYDFAMPREALEKLKWQIEKELRAVPPPVERP